LVINARPGERILRVFEGKANTFEALGDKKIVGLSMREADLVGHRLDCFSAQARANEVFEGADRCELVADLEHTFCPDVKFMRGYAVRSRGGIMRAFKSARNMPVPMPSELVAS